MNQLPLITIQISKYLSLPLLEAVAVAKWGDATPARLAHLRRTLHIGAENSDWFYAVMQHKDGRVVGMLYCVQNESNPKLWYYGDLFVIPEMRRCGIATALIQAAMTQLRERGAHTLRCYVEPSNNASLALQHSLGFKEQPFQRFNSFDNDGQMMLEAKLPSPYTVIPAGKDDTEESYGSYWEACRVLHQTPLSYREFQLHFTVEGRQSFLVCIGALPAAYMQLERMENPTHAQLRYLCVQEEFLRRGIGTHALQFAEHHLACCGVQQLCVKLPTDASFPLSFYQKHGYETVARQKKIFADGTQMCELTLQKNLIP